MTTRTFQQYGQGYGSTPVVIVATVNGEQVYSGTVPTIDQPLPSLPQLDVTIGNVVFTWSGTVNFAGTQQMQISVSNGTFLLCDTYANYITEIDPVSGNVISSGSDNYGAFFYQTIDGVTYGDPLTDEKLDGVVLQPTQDPILAGQFYWRIPAGYTFTATVNINAGLE